MPAKRTAVFYRGCGKQRGAALMIMLVILVVGMAAVLINSLTSSSVKTARLENTVAALALAKSELIGYSIKETSITDAGYLLVPDTGWTSTPEGNSEGNVGIKDISVIGKLPWKTLGTAPLRDAQEECLWYIVSGRFKSSPKTDVLNWDTLGQIDVIDTDGNPIIKNVAAMIVSPGSVLDSQNRTLADPALIQCGGNYNAINYLDAYNIAYAISGELNYFVGSANNHLAPNTNNKRFVQASNDHYNDKFLFVTVEDIFRPVIRRSDFRDQIAALMNDPYFQTVTISGPKGTNDVVCNGLGVTNRTFCNNWKEVLLLKTTTSGPCNHALIFGGQRTAAQTRLSVADKNDPANYLEGANLIEFADPTANYNGFTEVLAFDADNPSTDLLRCLP